MTTKTPEKEISQEIAKNEALWDISTDALAKLAKAIRSLKAKIESGEEIDLKQATEQTRDLEVWLRNYVTLENRLAELKSKHRGADEGGQALNLDRARLEIGSRLARLRAASGQG